MNWFLSFCFVLLLATTAQPHIASRNVREIEEMENEALSNLSEMLKKASEKCFNSVTANWNYSTDINDANEKAKLEANLASAAFTKEMAKNLTIQYPNWKIFKNFDLRRMMEKSTDLGSAALPEDQLKERNKLMTDMQKTYSTTKICGYKNKDQCTLALDPELTKILKESRNEEELRHVWTEWHDKSGKPIKNSYKRFVELNNEAARLNGYPDAGAYWLKQYESDTFKEDVEQLWLTMKPLYEQIHAYVRAKLRDVYGGQFNTSDGLIPAHLLGNMWAQWWTNIYSLVVPYPNKTSIDVTKEMNEQGYNALKMFQTSDEFFTSLGLIPMPDAFWQHSMIEKPQGREVVCHASAWDFCNGKDFRIKQCTVVTTEQLVTVHHEMGHVQYYLLYKDQPSVYRRGANPGFHEAVGDTLALSVQTPKHLKQIHLLNDKTPIDDYETTINFLMNMALDKIVGLPWTYLIDRYRWDIFDGSVDSSNYNSYWWKLRKEYQGLKPPSPRPDDDGLFDAGAKYHIPSNTEYLRYFVSRVIQFQFHRSLCQVAGQYDAKDPSKPLHNCDIYKSKEAGARLAAGLSMGSSRPWPEAMKVITGQEKMDASAIREYFAPLEDWLKTKNAELLEVPGWKN